MAENSRIEWTQSTWNPVRGCSRVSPGCGGPGPHGGCYAEIMAARFSQPGQWGHGFATMKGGDHRWTGKVALIESQLDLPLRWKTPRRIFVNSTSDLFHEALPDEAIDRVFAVMALCPQHIFQVLTKRADRMRRYFSAPDVEARVAKASVRIEPLSLARTDIDIEIQVEATDGFAVWPLPNVWLGVSVEDQERADERIPLLLETPAAVRFISAEPLLGPLDIRRHLAPEFTRCQNSGSPAVHQIARAAATHVAGVHFLDWIIAGGESGYDARPMHPSWVRSLRDQCAASGVPFFFKQWGEWGSADDMHKARAEVATVLLDGRVREWQRDYPNARLTDPRMHPMVRVGKGRAGRLLDGREWNEFPVQR